MTQFRRGAGFCQDPLAGIPLAPDEQAFIVLDTIEELRAYAFSAASFPDGQLIYVKGYYAAQDGGGGFFNYHRSGTVTDDGGKYIIPDNTYGYYERVMNEGYVNVLWFGAVGDNVTLNDDFFANAITSLGGYGGEVLVPQGEYQFVEKIELPSLISLMGQGMDVTVLRFSGVHSGLSVDGTSLALKSKVMVRNMAVYGSTGATVGLLLDYAPYCFFENIRFYGFVIGVQVTNSWQVYLGALIGESCTQDGFNFGVDANSIKLIGCAAYSNARAGFYVEGARSLTLVDCNAEGNQYDVEIAAQTALPTEKVSILGGYYEGATGAAEIFIHTNGGAVYPKAITIRDAYFVALAASKQGIRSAQCNTLLVDGCHFSDAGTAFQYSLYLPDAGVSTAIVWGVGNLDESTTGIFAGAGMSYTSVDTS